MASLGGIKKYIKKNSAYNLARKAEQEAQAKAKAEQEARAKEQQAIQVTKSTDATGMTGLTGDYGQSQANVLTEENTPTRGLLGDYNQDDSLFGLFRKRKFF